ncbi:hypothetical protein [Aquimarina brevivitae]|uniref:Uncharacterized protein n=1 Tax=Aquimarina brevivitae TaxID=323412 RepID=A0A4Q7NXR9_9FLAO|nr:hypothetical protein [Aquimarina brevivitae]RZS92201.1 hypothetical protein EV197_2837 [Aquimarina brevivitae]
MAPLKFEDNVKEKLDNREINPSADSWDTLAKQLDDHQQEKAGKTNYTIWYLIAASIIGIVIITSVVLTNNNITTTTPTQLVNTNKETPRKLVPNNTDATTEDRIVDQLKSNTNLAVDEVAIDTKKEKNEILSNTNARNTKFHETANVNRSSDKRSAIVLADKTSGEMDNDNVESLVEEKVAAVFEEVQQLEQSKTQVTDQEIEELLRKAQQEITTQKMMENHSVDAMALLDEVETEMEESFKEKVFEALKTGYQKVKSAVAERNN